MNAEIERDVPQHATADEKARATAEIMRKHGVSDVNEDELRRKDGG